MITGAVPPAERVALRAYLRSVTNPGIAPGSLAGGVALLLDTRPAYVAMILVDAATYLLTALILSRATDVPPVPAAAAGTSIPVVVRWGCNAMASQIRLTHDLGGIS